MKHFNAKIKEYLKNKIHIFNRGRLMTENHQQTNKFDNIEININLIKNNVLKNKTNLHRYLFPKFNLFLKIFFRAINISKEFTYSYIFTDWFNEFKDFWTQNLQGRPIDIIDFHFLRLSYRTKFQNVKHTNETDKDEYLKAWNLNECIYLLFGSVWINAKSSYLDLLHYYFRLPKRGKVLEYGCGIAPFTTGMLKYFPSKKYDFEIVDILQINFLYAIYRLSNKPNVSYRILDPQNNLAYKNNYSAIICKTVLKHIPNPLEVVKSFHNALKNNGILIFDFIKGDGDGLDSKQSVHEREETLKFIIKNFKIIKGHINIKKNVNLCIAKKMNNLASK